MRDRTRRRINHRLVAVVVMSIVLVLIVYLNWPDSIRIVAVGLFAFVLAQAIVINWTVHKLQKSVAAPPAMLSWHVHAVTVYALGMHAILATLSFERIGQDRLTSFSVLLVLLGIIGNAAMYLIGRITAARARVSKDFEEQINGS